MSKRKRLWWLESRDTANPDASWLNVTTCMDTYKEAQQRLIDIANQGEPTSENGAIQLVRFNGREARFSDGWIVRLVTDTFETGA